MLERTYYEQSINFQRVPQETLLEDYPFAGENDLKSDKQINIEKIKTPEIEEHISEQRSKLEKLNKQIIEK